MNVMQLKKNHPTLEAFQLGSTTGVEILLKADERVNYLG